MFLLPQFRPQALPDTSSLPAAIRHVNQRFREVSAALPLLPGALVINVQDAPYSAGGLGLTDDTAAIQAAITAAGLAGGGLVFLPAGIYCISGPLTFASVGVVLRGVGKYATILRGTSETLHYLRVTGLYTTLEDFQLEQHPDTPRTGGGGFYITAPSETTRINRVRIGSVGNYIDIIGSTDGTASCTNVQIMDVQWFEQPGGVGLHARGIFAQCASSIFITKTGGGITRTQAEPDFHVDAGVDTFVMQDCGNASGSFGGSAPGFRVSKTLAVGSYSFPSRIIRLTNCTMEPGYGTGMIGFDIGTSDYDHIYQSCYAVVGQQGFRVAGGKGLLFDGCVAYANKEHGFELAGGDNVRFDECTASDNSQALTNTYSGFSLNPSLCPNFTVTNCLAGDMVLGLPAKQAYGFAVFAGTGTSYRLLHNRASGNVTAQSLDNGSAAQKVIDDTDGLVDSARRVVPTSATVTYAPAMTPDATAVAQTITATNGVAFTINAPTNLTTGQALTLTIRNTSGGALGAVTYNAIYKLAAWTQPATGFSRSITFVYDGTNCVERNRTPDDVPN